MPLISEGVWEGTNSLELDVPSNVLATQKYSVTLGAPFEKTRFSCSSYNQDERGIEFFNVLLETASPSGAFRVESKTSMFIKDVPVVIIFTKPWDPAF